MPSTSRDALSTDYNEFKIIIDQGFEQRFRVLDVDENDVKTPRDLTGYTAKMSVRKSASRLSEEIVTLTTENGRIILGEADPTDGWINLFISATDTDSAPINENVGKAFYDFFLIPPTGQPDINERLLTGSLQIVGSTTDV